jgi:hypothetical protein
MKEPSIPIAPPPSNLSPILIGGRRLLSAIYVPRPQVKVPTCHQFQASELARRQAHDHLLTVAETDIHL